MRSQCTALWDSGESLQDVRLPRLAASEPGPANLEIGLHDLTEMHLLEDHEDGLVYAAGDRMRPILSLELERPTNQVAPDEAPL